MSGVEWLLVAEHISGSDLEHWIPFLSISIELALPSQTLLGQSQTQIGRKACCPLSLLHELSDVRSNVPCAF